MADSKNITDTKIGQTVTIGRMKGNINLGAKIYKMTSKELFSEAKESLYGEHRKIGLEASVKIKYGKPISIKVTSNKKNGIYKDLYVNVLSDFVPQDKAKSKPITFATIVEQLSKTGNTPYEFSKITVDLDDNVFIPKLSIINELRRCALAEVERFAISKITRKPKDLQSILEKILLKIDKPANSLFNPSLEFCNTTMQNATFNPQKAKENLTQSTYNQEALQFVYVANNPIQKAIAEAIQNNLAKSGIKIELIASEPIGFFQKQKNGDFDLIFNETWGNPFDPHSFIASMLIPSHADFAAQKDLNSRQKIESTIHKILNQTDEKILKHDYQTLLNLLDESAIYLPLSHNVVLGIYNKTKIKSYQIGAMETEFLFEAMEVK